MAEQQTLHAYERMNHFKSWMQSFKEKSQASTQVGAAVDDDDDSSDEDVDVISSIGTREAVVDAAVITAVAAHLNYKPGQDVSHEEVRAALLAIKTPYQKHMDYFTSQMGRAAEARQQECYAKESVDVALAMRGTAYIPTDDMELRWTLSNYAASCHAHCNLEYSDVVIVSDSNLQLLLVL